MRLSIRRILIALAQRLGLGLALGVRFGFDRRFGFVTRARGFVFLPGEHQVVRDGIVAHRQTAAIHGAGRRVSLLRSTKRAIAYVQATRTPPRVAASDDLPNIKSLPHVEAVAAIHPAHHLAPRARRPQPFRLLSALMTALSIHWVVYSAPFIVVTVLEQRPRLGRASQSLRVPRFVHLLVVPHLEQIPRRVVRIERFRFFVAHAPRRAHGRGAALILLVRRPLEGVRKVCFFALLSRVARERFRVLQHAELRHASFVRLDALEAL